MKKQAVYIGSEIYRKASFGRNHPLAYARQESVLDMCRVLGWLPKSAFVKSPIADYNTLIRYHDPLYVQALKQADFRGKATREDRELYKFGTMENPLFQGVFRRASTTIGGSILAAKKAMDGHLVFHPSGGTHHGLKHQAHGFCYFNDPVFALQTFLDAGHKRIAYVDIDAHHGDGVELAFADDPRVCFVSVHEDKRWPHTGTLADQRPGQMNIPVPYGINDSEYRLIIDQLVVPALTQFAPEAI
ncbi:MAG TPA: acetoin utilization protein AcuC, partial [Hellea balneolensis]|nr:acetoin utilization protein AcuC [Hellea balneolensis]